MTFFNIIIECLCAIKVFLKKKDEGGSLFLEKKKKDEGIGKMQYEKVFFFYEQEAIGIVLFKVRNLRKTRNFGQKFSNFSSNLLTGMVIVGRI